MRFCTSVRVCFFVIFAVSPYALVLADKDIESPSERLLALAKERLPKFRIGSKPVVLTDPLKRFLRGVAEGKPTQFDKDAPASEKLIDARCIAWLCFDSSAKELVSSRGIFLSGATIDGKLELAFAHVHFPLAFFNCIFENDLILMKSDIRDLILFGSRCKAIIGSRVIVDGDVILSKGFVAEGKVDLTGANIGSSLICDGGHFLNVKPCALDFTGSLIKGDVGLGEGFKAHGSVRFSRAKIGGKLDCDKGHFLNEDNTAISAYRVSIQGSVYMGNGFKALGEVAINGGEVRGHVHCDKGHFSNKDGRALRLSATHIHGGLFLNKGFSSDGEVTLIGATIGESLMCIEAMFSNPGPNRSCINADRIHVKGSVFLKDEVNCIGEVRFPAATIGADFQCSNAILKVNCDGKHQPDAIVLNGNAMTVEGSVILSPGFEAHGVVSFVGSTIRRSLQGIAARIKNPGGVALYCDSTDIGDTVFLRDGFHATGCVRFLYAKIGATLDCSRGRFESGITNDSQKDAVLLDSATITGGIFFSKDFHSMGRVSLIGSFIGGDLDCTDGKFSNRSGEALSADRITVLGNVWLVNDFQAKGVVDFSGSAIGGSFDCSGADLEGEEGRALNVTGIAIKGNLILKCQVEGGIAAAGARVSQSFRCSGANFNHPSGNALVANNILVDGNIYFDKSFQSNGRILMYAAKIGGSFFASSGRFLNEGSQSLRADELQLTGSMYLDDEFESHGEFSLFSAKIAGSIKCSGAKFSNKDTCTLSDEKPKNGVQNAFVADSAEIGGSVFLNPNFSSVGPVSFMSAQIKGNLYCNGKFDGNGGPAIKAARINVTGASFNGDFESIGEVQLGGAEISRNLDCRGGRFYNSNGIALSAWGAEIHGSVHMTDSFDAEGEVSFSGASIGGALAWSDIVNPEKLGLDLRFATIGMISDSQSDWPPSGNLLLNGLEYRVFSDDAPKSASDRIDWLERQPVEPLHPQPYQQLSKVLSYSGYAQDASKVLIHKEVTTAKSIKFGWSNLLSGDWIWYKLFGPCLGFGHRPWRAFWIALIVVFVGVTVSIYGFSGREESVLFVPTKKVYPAFNSFVFSLDSFIPLIDFGQAKSWAASARRGKQVFKMSNLHGPASLLVHCGWSSRMLRPICLYLLRIRSGSFLRTYLWCHTIVGWILTTLLVVGLTGLVTN